MSMPVSFISARIHAYKILVFSVCFATWMCNGVLVTYVEEQEIFNRSTLQIGWSMGTLVLIGTKLKIPIGTLSDKGANIEGWRNQPKSNALLLLHTTIKAIDSKPLIESNQCP